MPYQDPRADSMTGGLVDLLINDGQGRPGADSTSISGTTWDGGEPATVQDLGSGVG